MEDKENLKQYFDILEINYDSSLEEVQIAYNHLIKLYSTEQDAFGAISHNFTSINRENIIEKIDTAYNHLVSQLKSGDELKKQSKIPQVIFTANSEKALQLMDGKNSININKFPFKIGRKPNSIIDSISQKNNFNLIDLPPFSISRTHFAIVTHNNKFYFEDIGSKLGTFVNGTKIGGKYNNTDNILLKRGCNKIVFGTSAGKLTFSILINVN